MRIGEPRYYRAEQVRALDQAAIAQIPVSGYALMERAATAAWQAAWRRWPRIRRVHVYCGPGNNGGDAYLLAHLAREAGMSVCVSAPCGPPKGADARKAQSLWAGAQDSARGGSMAELPDLVVDGLLGIGLSRPISSAMAAAVAEIAEWRSRGAVVLALDVPSGLNADTGAAMGAAVTADLTVSFVARKPGLYTGSGPDYCGVRLFDDLQLPWALYSNVDAAAAGLGAATIARALPRRRASSHKGSSGRLLVVGGAPGMSGAALMAGRAALRAGAGLVRVATHPDHAVATAAAQPELMVVPVADSSSLRHYLAEADAVVVGPGLGQCAWARHLWAICLEAKLPVLVDADALNLLAREPLHQPNWVLTPHPGEAARLLGCSSREVQSDRFEAVMKLKDRYGGTAVLKGAGTLVGGHRTWLCPHGNAGMAVGGMGDVLSGVIGGLLAQGLDRDSAACVGVAAHALAADRAPAAGQRGLLPMDVVEQLPAVLAGDVARSR